MNPDTKSPEPIDVTKKTNPFSKLINSLRSSAGKVPPTKRLMIVGGTGIAILVVGVGAIQMFGPKPAEPDPVPVVESTYAPPAAPTTEASRLTGVQVPIGQDARPVTAVMIENSVDARPQAGLKDAGVVFEAIAEGGITRFMALFQTEQSDHIGPIRSARPYYVRWAAGFDAAYAHSGGSNDAIALIRSIGLKDLNHGSHPGSFDRVSNRFAPHNVYTSMARLDSLREQLGYTASNFTGFERIAPPAEDEAVAAEDAAPVTPAAEKANSIVFDISSSNYNTSYTYNPDTNKYARVMAGVPHNDERSGEQIQPTVVVALETSYAIHPNGIHSIYYNTGAGLVTVFQNGEVIKGGWSKASDSAELKFTDIEGDPLYLEPGQTWITAIHNDRFSHSL